MIGERDEAISVCVGQLAATYQHAIGAGNTKVQAISTGLTSRRGTFVTAIPGWKNGLTGWGKGAGLICTPRRTAGTSVLENDSDLIKSGGARPAAQKLEAS